MRIAVIGSGISGLSSAFLLAPHAEVTLYESENRLGGHAHTETVSYKDTALAVDTGFMVFNPVQYPFFVSLLKHLNIKTTDTAMSFSVSLPHTEYSSTYAGFFTKQNIIRPAFWRLLYHILRFNWYAKKFLKGTEDTLTLGAFLSAHRFPSLFAEQYLFPMLGSIWSAAATQMDEYPAYETFRFLNNHLLLQTFTRPQWRTVQGGSTTYVEALARKLRAEGVRVLQGTSVTSVRRDSEGAHVFTTESRETYAAVIFATHANIALSLIESPSTVERQVLGGFSYSSNTVVLHSDESFMPQTKSVWASWNYHALPHRISLTYWMNSLQHLPPACPVFVTLNPEKAPAQVHATYVYEHPIFNLEARRSQLRLPDIQGKDRFYFAGAHWGFGFHEDGIASAVHAVQALGFPIRLTP